MLLLFETPCPFDAKSGATETCNFLRIRGISLSEGDTKIMKHSHIEGTTKHKIIVTKTTKYQRTNQRLQKKLFTICYQGKENNKPLISTVN